MLLLFFVAGAAAFAAVVVIAAVADVAVAGTGDGAAGAGKYSLWLAVVSCGGSCHDRRVLVGPSISVGNLELLFFWGGP